MSHRGELTERMMRLPLLLAERPHSQQELARIFNVNGKTIRRAIDTLSSYYPIIEEREGREVFYHFSNNYKYQPPALTPAELATLILAQESIAATGFTAPGSPFARYGLSLMAKVKSSLPRHCATSWTRWPRSSALRPSRRKTSRRTPRSLTA